MTPPLEQIARPLLARMDNRVRQGVQRRLEAMERELAFLAERQEPNVSFIARKGWSIDRLQLVFLLNSVYQNLLGPLQAAARGGPDGLGSKIPVRHGKTIFNRATASSVQMAMRDFFEMVDALHLPRAWLQLNTCGDLVFAIATHERTSREG
jgi:hypothetical protein